jgi:hypothetical protein
MSIKVAKGLESLLGRLGNVGTGHHSDDGDAGTDSRQRGRTDINRPTNRDGTDTGGD